MEVKLQEKKDFSEALAELANPGPVLSPEASMLDLGAKVFIGLLGYSAGMFDGLLFGVCLPFTAIGATPYYLAYKDLAKTKSPETRPHYENLHQNRLKVYACGSIAGFCLETYLVHKAGLEPLINTIMR